VWGNCARRAARATSLNTTTHEDFDLPFPPRPAEIPRFIHSKDLKNSST
jgi:hypothetical protein